jgi:hypothetical protein
LRPAHDGVIARDILIRVGGVLCDVYCEAEFAGGGADLALFAGVVASADPFCRGWV